MKRLSISFFLLMCLSISQLKAQSTPKATKLWVTDTVLTGSESCFYDAEKGLVFVSNGNTQAAAKDNDGFISLLTPEGKIQNLHWVKGGLDAPKGMAKIGAKLYVSDIDAVKIIDIPSAKIEKVIPIEGAVFLNDVTSDGTNIYVSDTRAGTVYRIDSKHQYTKIIENAPNINGLAFKEQLYALDGQGLKKFSSDGKYTAQLLTDEVKGGDGLIIIDQNTFIASRWGGQVYIIQGQKAHLILDTQAEGSNTADIDYIADQKRLLVPTFLKNQVAAYQLSFE
jgi:DNA-binding beta-propeller fold protein YncE